MKKKNQNEAAPEPTGNRNFPIEFQQELIDFIRNMIGASAVRFWLINPQINLKGYVAFNVDEDTEEVYQDQYSHLDPMHPSRYEDTDVTVICSDTMMSGDKWRQSEFYLEFMAPRHFDHDTDVFFRRNGRITAVLSILRDDRLGPFQEHELDMLRRMQPFLEYSLNNVYIPKRFSDRDLFADKYNLTARELDVVEIVMVGADIKSLAARLNLSQATVKTHLQHIFEKTGVHSTRELISLLFRDLN